MFADYGRDDGGNSLSRSLMKHVRMITTDKRFSVHSLRHRLRDRLALAGAPENVYKGIQGWASTGIAESTYGSAKVRLKVQREWLDKALEV